MLEKKKKSFSLSAPLRIVYAHAPTSFVILADEPRLGLALNSLISVGNWWILSSSSCGRCGVVSIPGTRMTSRIGRDKTSQVSNYTTVFFALFIHYCSGSSTYMACSHFAPGADHLFLLNLALTLAHTHSASSSTNSYSRAQYNNVSP